MTTPPPPQAPPVDLGLQAVHTCLAYFLVQEHRGQSVTHRQKARAEVIKLRDGLTNRAKALVWHADWITRFHDAAIRRGMELLTQREKQRDFMIFCAEQEQWLFDDLVFNAVSLFDYVGNLIGYTLYSERRRRAKWQGISDYAGDAVRDTKAHGQARLSMNRTGRAVISAHRELVSALSQYRADVFHYDALAGKGSARYTFKPLRPGHSETDIRFDLTLTVPKSFAKKLTVTGYEQEPSAAQLCHAAPWLVGRSFDVVATVLRELERDLREEAGYDPDDRSAIVKMP